MASKRAQQRFPGRPFLLDNTPEIAELWLRSKFEMKPGVGMVESKELPPFCVIAYETADGWIGRRKGVDLSHPAITWLKGTFESVPNPSE